MTSSSSSDPVLSLLQTTAPADRGELLENLQDLAGGAKINTKSSALLCMLPLDPFMDVADAEPSPLNPKSREDRPFLQMPSFNQKEDGYRSPWTNQFYVVVEGNDDDEHEEVKIYEVDTSKDDERQLATRMLEKAANEVWGSYANMYYGKKEDGVVSSAYLRPTGKKSGDLHAKDEVGAFDGVFAVQKRTGLSENKEGEAIFDCSWDSVHIVRVDTPNVDEKTCRYTIESAVLVTLRPSIHGGDVSASLTKTTEKTHTVKFSSLMASHLEHIGSMCEDIEIDFRSRLERVHLPMTMEVIQSMYRKSGTSATAHLFGPGSGSMSGSYDSHDGSNGEVIHATGMGVGASMIGEIASRAKSKQKGGGGPNPFMEAMKSNMAAKQQQQQQAVPQVMDVQKALKSRKPKTPSGPSAAAAVPTPEFLNFRNKLKKTTK